MIPDRSALLAVCRALLSARAEAYLRELASLNEAAAGETKSSAGDKYETAREMMAQQRNLLERNLAEAQAGLENLERMGVAPPGSRIAFGSLVETNLGWHLVGTGLGEVDCSGIVVRLISLASPLGGALKGRSAGDRIPWRGAELEILRVVNQG
jgi:transcription elongation GreA/GreB family factor